MRFFLAMLLSLFAAVATADELKTFTVSLPVENTDGTAIEPADLAQIELLCSNVDGGPYQSIVELPVTDTWQRTMPTGDWYCVARVNNVDGEYSAFSNQIFFTVAPSIPNPPTILSVD